MVPRKEWSLKKVWFKTALWFFYHLLLIVFFCHFILVDKILLVYQPFQNTWTRSTSTTPSGALRQSDNPPQSANHK